MARVVSSSHAIFSTIVIRAPARSVASRAPSQVQSLQSDGGPGGRAGIVFL
jgi:hypothetical protein